MKDLSEFVGRFGLWHGLLFLHYITVHIFQGVNNLNSAILVPDNQEYWCAPPEGGPWNASFWKEIGIPKDKDGKVDRCNSYLTKHDDDSNKTVIFKNTTIPCSNWYYDHSVYTYTLIEKWNLVCQKDLLEPLVQTSTMFGFLFGNFVIGHLFDIWGRRPTFMTCTVVFVASSILPLAGNSNFYVFVAGRFQTAFSLGGLNLYTILFEVLPAKLRFLYIIAEGHGFAIGGIIIAGVSMLGTYNWIVIYGLIMVPGLVSLLYFFIAYESPRWLLAQKRFDEAEQSIRKIASFNKIPDDRVDEAMLDIRKLYENIQPHKTKSVFDLFITWKLARITLSVCFHGFAWGIMYYAATMISTDIGGNPHYDFMATYVIEIASYTLAVFTSLYLPRKIVTASSISIATILCFAIGAIDEENYVLNLTLSLISRFALNIGMINYEIYIIEIFPTPLRRLGSGMYGVMYRLAAAVQPYISKGLMMYGRYALMYFMGCLGVPAVLCIVFFFPETLNRFLVDEVKGSRMERPDSSKRCQK